MERVNLAALVERGIFASMAAARKLAPRLVSQGFPAPDPDGFFDWAAVSAWRAWKRDAEGLHFPLRHGPWS